MSFEREDVFQMLLGDGRQYLMQRSVSPIPSMHQSSMASETEELRNARHRTPSPPPQEPHHLDDHPPHDYHYSQQPQAQRHFSRPQQHVPRQHSSSVEIPQHTPEETFYREFDNLMFQGMEPGRDTPPHDPNHSTFVSRRKVQHHAAQSQQQQQQQQQVGYQNDSVQQHSSFVWANPVLAGDIDERAGAVGVRGEVEEGQWGADDGQFSPMGILDIPLEPHHDSLSPPIPILNTEESNGLMLHHSLYKHESIDSFESDDVKEELPVDPHMHTQMEGHELGVDTPLEEMPAMAGVNGKGEGNKANGRKPRSPKSEAEREKNREAVRNCRKRKRKLEEHLRVRQKELIEEGDRLRLQLRLGSQELETEIKNRAMVLIDQMKELLETGKPEEKEMKGLLLQYKQLYEDIHTNRSEAFKSIIERLKRLNSPFPPSKMYLWQNKQDDWYFKVNGGMWEEMVRTLGLTTKQTEDLRKRRNRVANVCKEIEVTLQDIKKLEVILKKIQRKPFDSANFAIVTNKLSAVQTARLLAFVYGDEVRERNWNPDERWENFLRSFDQSIQKARAMGTYKFTLPEDSPTNEEEKQDQLRCQRFKSAQIIKRFLEGKQGVDALAKKVFTDQAEMLDPNFKDPLKGREAIVKHFSALRNAFSRIVATQDKFNMKRNKNVARGTWVLSGVYMGNKGDGESRTGKPVTFPLTCAFNFVPGSAKVKSLVVSWAAFDLMQQLGILPSEVLETRSKRSSLTTKQFHERCRAFCKAFEEDVSEDRLKIVKEYLDEDCTVRDTNFGTLRGFHNFAVYLEKFRIIFPKIGFSDYKFHGKDSSRLPVKIHIGLLAQADYRGELAGGRSVNVEFPGELLFAFNPENDKIMEIVMTWQISAFLKQINVVR